MEKVKIQLNESQTSEKAPNGIIDKIALLFLLSIPLVLPLFFIPSPSFPFQFSKMILLSFLVFAVFGLWTVFRLKDGRFIFPATKIFFAGLLVLVVSLASALFSDSVRESLFGQSLELGTVGAMLVMFLLMFLVPLLFRLKDHVFYAYLLFFASFFVISIFHILRFFLGAGFLSFGIFTDITSNTIGKWNDLAIFSGLVTLLSLITLELISLSWVWKILAYLAFVISLIFLAVVNLSLVWYALAVFGLVLIVYVISFDKSEPTPLPSEGVSETNFKIRRVPTLSLVVLIISLVFILAGNQIGAAISAKTKISQIEVRPSWSATISVAREVLTQEPLLGSGPNLFIKKWLLYKPNIVNSTAFWNTDFNFGVGLVPTYMISSGLLGTLSWLVFLALFLYAGFRATFSSISDKISRYLVSSSFSAALFLWVFSFFYIPSSPIVALTFFFTGLFIASLYQARILRSKEILFVEDPKRGFVSVLILILILIGTVTVSYAFADKFIGAAYFTSAVYNFNKDGNALLAEATVLKATNFDEAPIYFRVLSEAGLLQINSLLSPDNVKTISPESLRTQFQTLFVRAKDNAQKAVALDSSDYQNWISLGRLYEAVIPLNIPNSNTYESARNAYDKALMLNPKSPAMLLIRARLEVTHGDLAKAKNFVEEAIKMKNNYTDAIFLLAQIQVSEGNLKDAIASVEAVAFLSPNDPGTYFQLGILRYNNKNFAGAADALIRAVELNKDYANAKYFLGLSYYQLGKVSDAIGEFKDLKITNPDNKEVDLILKNLRSGLPPFADAKPPIDSKPEKRPKPPVTETKKSSGQAPANIDNADGGNSPGANF